MKSNLWIGLLFGIFWGAQAHSINLSSPLLCPVGESLLLVENSGDESEAFWFQTMGTSPFREKYHQINARSSLLLPLADDYTQDSSAIAIKTHSPQLKFQGFCKASGLHWKIEQQSSPWKRLRLPAGTRRVRLHVVNLAQTENRLQIKGKSQSGVLSEVALSENFASTELELPVPPGTQELRIQAAGRWSAKVFTKQGTELSLQEDTVSLVSVPSAPRYFLFQSSDGSDSFVVPLENQQLIQQSLEQIKDPQKQRLLVARIKKSLEGVNRDLNHPTKNPWSWQVTEAQTYADFAHISCDGSPEVIEERLNDWIQNTGGTICFWSYHVTREVSVTELKQSPWLWPPGPASLQHKH